MGEDLSDEIILTRVQEACDDVVLIAPTTPRRRKATMTSRKKTAETRKTPEDRKRLKSKPDSVGGLCRVRVVDMGTESVVYLRKTDTLESIHQEICKSDPQAKMKYKSVIVSKYLTLQEIKFDEEDGCILVQHAEDQGTIKVRVNVDTNRTVELPVVGDNAVTEILSGLKDTGFYGDFLVRNGVVIDCTKPIKDVLKNEDVVDLIMHHDVLRSS